MIWSGSLFSKTIVIGSGSLFSKTIVIVSGSILRGPSVSLCKVDSAKKNWSERKKKIAHSTAILFEHIHIRKIYATSM